LTQVVAEAVNIREARVAKLKPGPERRHFMLMTVLGYVKLLKRRDERRFL